MGKLGTGQTAKSLIGGRGFLLAGFVFGVLNKKKGKKA